MLRTARPSKTDANPQLLVVLATTVRGFRLSVILLVTVLLAMLAFQSAAFAQEHWYAGNMRSLGAGVQADIRTPSTTPEVSNGGIANFVSNIDENYGTSDWVQVGWCQGDGEFQVMDGTALPTVPKSYREAYLGDGAFYDFDLYSAQPLNYARACEVVAWSQQYGKWYWRTKIAGQNRGDYWGFVKKSPVVAESEMIVSAQNDCMAGFNNVEYKGDYTWMYFDQDNRIEYDPPFSLVWYYTWKYSTHAGDL